MQMSRQQADRLLASKAKAAAKQARQMKARLAAPGVELGLALEILKAQERAAARAAKREQSRK